MVASEKCKFEVVQVLIAKGAKVNAKTQDGWTALMSAVSGVKDHREQVDRMRVNHVKCPCDLCTRGEPLLVVKALLAAGADVNAKLRNGKTAFMVACESDPDTVRLLISKGAKVNAKDEDGSTPLEYTESSCLTKMEKEAISSIIGAAGDEEKSKPWWKF